MANFELPVAGVFEPLLQPSRYKGAYGGRGSAKSWFFADRLIDDSLALPGLRSVCIREVQKDLTHSAKQLLQDRLLHHNLGESDGFRVFKDRIETPGDGLILFQGMQDHNSESVKSLENIDRAWVEEAQTLSDRSLKMLRPTIRAKNSELWFSWNPRRKLDPVDVMLRQGVVPTNSIVVQANWNDNPWFPDVLEQERKDCLADPDEVDDYDHIWDGGYVSTVKGAYYARRLTEARSQGRVTEVTLDPLMGVHVFADIGGTGKSSDAFAMWVCQFVGTQVRVLDCYEAVGQDLATHLAWLRLRGYETPGTQMWLPHDGATHDRVYSVSYESAFTEAGYEVEVVPNQGKGAAMARIEAGRRVFPSVWFNQSTTESGLEALGWYHEKIDKVRNVGLGPDHDWSSHLADAFGLMAIAHKQVRPKAAPTPIKYAGWGQ